MTLVFVSRLARLALQNLRILIKSALALFGQTGRGKSARVSLLERYHEAGSGRVLVYGRDITNLDVDV